jgi:hypothetical protein
MNLLVIGVKVASSSSGSSSHATPAASTASTTSAACPGLGADLACRALHTDPVAAQRRPVQPLDGIVCVAVILVLHKGKAGWVSGHPHAPQGPVVVEGLLDVLLVDIARQVPDVDLTVQAAVPRHTVDMEAWN